MPPHFLDRLTPRAYPRTRLLTAAIVWSAVGFFLTLKGIYIFREGSWGILLAVIVVGGILGVVKSKIVLDRVANRIILHIGAKPSRACLGGLFSVRNWLLIAVMIVFGRTLGVLPLDAAIKTGLYVMVGSGLVYSSRLIWNAWKNSPADLP
ncbi:MAG: hypothetical protein KUA37_19255 [Desulfomicrobium sp.]|nr:hypothetical protein [Pseudomonadota bacterium]MBV1714108.1 hypothetical protein [Desulfomicrobium sp.]MBU4571645.1 hypothetical protein [Pseudomonadota bacterium]MBU4595793.1 hypothetical protein [Pseudomonadota bacterium]MBV1721711.1 hypothetical protein [Desulfomicrobium sp.]